MLLSAFKKSAYINMNAGKIIGGVAIAYIFIYAIIQVLNFYGVPVSTYAVYLTFFIFLLVTGLMLPSQVPEV